MTDVTSGLTTGTVVKRQLGTLPMVAILYFSVSGGPYGLEASISASGPGMALLMLLIVPVIFAIPCALMVAELGSAMPVEGGYYHWVKAGLGRGAAVVQGIWNWILTFLDTALYPIVFADYLSSWIPGIERGKHVGFALLGGTFSFDAHWLVTIAFMVPLAYLNIRGSRLVGEMSTLLMILVLAPFVILSVYGLIHFATSDATLASSFTMPNESIWSSFGLGLGIVIWNYIGWESPSTILGEVDNPRRTYVRALWISVPLITISYLLPMIAALGSGLHADDPSAWADGDFADVGGLLAGDWLKVAIIVGAVIAQVGLFSSLLMSGSRVPRVLAGEGYLPRWLAHDHERFGTPARAIIVSCFVFALFCAMDFSALVNADVMVNLAALLMQFVALIVLRRRRPDLERPYKVPGGAIGLGLLVLGPAICTAWLVTSSFHEEPEAFWIGIGLLALGVVAYPLLRRRYSGEPTLG